MVLKQINFAFIFNFEMNEPSWQTLEPLLLDR